MPSTIAYPKAKEYAYKALQRWFITWISFINCNGRIFDWNWDAAYKSFIKL
jgi:hypothetical protein